MRKKSYNRHRLSSTAEHNRLISLGLAKDHSLVFLIGGFTLVELLVVIGIIGILVALLFPALSSIKRGAGDAKCLSNLHQIGMAFRGYIDEHNGYAPPHWGNPFFDPNANEQTYLWTGYLAPYLDGADGMNGRLSPIFDCPNDPDLKTRPKDRGYVSISDNWMISYGFNYAYLTSQDDWWMFSSDGYPNLRGLKNTTTLILAADSLPISAGGQLVALIDSLHYQDKTGGPDFRHQGRFNAIILDGHVEGLDAQSLGDSKYWQPQK